MKVFVKFFSKINLGDDLFLKILFERYPKINFVIAADSKYGVIFKTYKNVEIIEEPIFRRSFTEKLSRLYLYIIRRARPSMYPKVLRKSISRKQMRNFRGCNAFIAIGGSIFMQGKPLPAYGSIELFKLVNRAFDKVYYLGCNFGPYKTAAFRNEFYNIFREADDVCFRDTWSWKLFSDLANVRLASDIVFSLPVEQPKKIERSVGFSIISPRNNMDSSKYVLTYKALIQFYLTLGYEVYLFSFCSFQGDDQTIDTILSNVEATDSIHKVFYNGAIEEFLSHYAKVEKMYCGRFHSMILSMLFKQKFYPIIYSEKMTNVLDDIGYTGGRVQIEDFHTTVPEEMDREIEKCDYRIDDAVNSSERQFSGLDRLFV